MSTGYTILAAALIFIDLGVCFIIGLRTSGGAKNAEDYFIGGKKTGTVLLFLTAWASFSGAGNFIGQAGRGALHGISTYWFWLGEGLCGGIIMGYLLAPYLSRFKYLSMPHYIAGYLYGNDKTIRRLGGLAALMPNIVWPGAQIMGVSYVLGQVFHIDYRAAVLICGIVFVFYTVSGGVKAVIYADAVHGTVQMIFAIAVSYFGLKLINFDIGFLKTQILAIDPSKWNMFVDKPLVILTSFLTGLVGAVSNPIFWNRAFAAKDVKTAKKAYGLTFFLNIILVFIMNLLGIISILYGSYGDQALVWLIWNKMPKFCGVILAESVLAACLSCADTHLNCAAANIVSDIIDPEGKLDGAVSVRYAKIATLFAGIIAIISALNASSIYDALGNYGYTVCGGVLIPAFLIGLICRDKHQTEFRSRMSIKAARFGMLAGVIAAIIFEVIPGLSKFFGGGVIPAIVVTTVGMLISNNFCHDQTWLSAE
jgi:SSS family solute:Na+ symporter